MKLKNGMALAISMAFLSFGAFGADPGSDLGARIDIDTKKLSADELAVWTQVDRYWGRAGCCGRDSIVENREHLDMMHEDLAYWSFGAAGPQSKAALTMWSDKLEQKRGSSPPYSGTRLQYQIFPQKLVIHGNTAVAHYRYELAYINKENPNLLDRSQGRYSDVLVRDRPGAEWKFLSYIGGRIKE